MPKAAVRALIAGKIVSGRDGSTGAGGFGTIADTKFSKKIDAGQE
jgi:hypothetical protein